MTLPQFNNVLVTNLCQKSLNEIKAKTRNLHAAIKSKDYRAGMAIITEINESFNRHSIILELTLEDKKCNKQIRDACQEYNKIRKDSSINKNENQTVEEVCNLINQPDVFI